MTQSPIPSNVNENQEFIRTLPYNLKAEQMLLGAILINNELIYKVNEFLKPEHFFDGLHQKLYRSIEVIIEKNITANLITLNGMLGSNELFTQAGGNSYLVKLTTFALTVINPHDYGKIIYDLAIKRSLINIGEEIVNNAYNPSVENDAKQQIEDAESKLYNLAAEGVNERSFIQIKDSVAQSITVIDRAIKNSDKGVIGISTGLLTLDRTLSGFRNSDLVIIAGRPSMGKTAFAINFALNACQHLNSNNNEHNIPAVGFFSLEMSSEQLTTRMLSIYSKIDSHKLSTGNGIGEKDYNDLCKAAVNVSNMSLYIDDTPALSISAIRTRARKLKRKHNLGILFIDYLQLIRANTQRDNRVLEISEITQTLKAIAKELNIPVIALSQLSRAVETREDKRPMLSDLRESGSIEQDADIVMFVYREEYYLVNKQPSTTDGTKYAEWQSKLHAAHNIAEIIIAKHRNGPVTSTKLYYDKAISLISDLDTKHTSNSYDN